MSYCRDQYDAAVPLWPIYILTLQGDHARRAALLQSMDELELPYQLFMGVDGRDGLADQWCDQIDRQAALTNLGREMTNGEFACALSHRAIYHDIVEKGHAGAIVLEDDAIVDSTFAEFYRSRAYECADLVMLDHSHARVWGTGIDVLPDVSARRLSLPPSLNTGYSISNAAAAELRRAATPITTTADWPGDIVHLGAVALEPQVVRHQDPQNGASHLRIDRLDMERSRGGLSRALKRWSSIGFWGKWITKRRSDRIS